MRLTMENDNEENVNEEETYDDGEGPNIKEVQEIIATLKTNKSPSMDEIIAQMFKYGGKKLEEQIYRLIHKIWTEKKVPQDWVQAILCPLYKKGKREDCENYRDIALLNVAYTILAHTIKNRRTQKMDNVVGEYQSGFRKGRGVVDQIFTLREIQAESHEHQKNTHILFVDFKQAYDRVKRSELYKALQELDVNPKLIRMVKMTLHKTENRVEVKEKYSKKFECKAGLRQCDPTSSCVI